MRRKEREVKDFEELLSILEEGNFLSLALSTKDVPYVVPLNYGYTVEGEKVTLFLHGATAGQKIDILTENPKVAFTICSYEKIIERKKAEHWTSFYRSIIGTGTAYFLQSDAEKIHGLDALMKHCHYEGTPEYSDSVLKRLAVIKIEVESLTGKQNR